MRLKEKVRPALGRVRHAYRGRGMPRAHYLHVGKTGGTAIKTALRPVATAGSYRLDLHGHQFTLARVPAGERFFFATRDPIARFVSGFYSRQHRGEPPSRSPWSPGEAQAFQEFRTANELAEQIDSNPGARRAMQAIVHVRSPYSSWFGPPDDLLARLDDLLFILRLEHLVDDFPHLLPRLGLEGRAALPADDVGSHRGPSAVDRTLSARAVANLRAWYDDDYRFVELCESIAADL
jgi:hypothetical protein